MRNDATAKPTPLIVDPGFSALCPPLTPEELLQLEDSIKAEGCHDALKVWKGHNTIIDGMNRHTLCIKHGKGFAVKFIDLPDRNAVVEWIIRNQFGRRNLTAGQRAGLVLKLEPIIAERAKEKQREGGKLKQNSAEASIETREELAKRAGVSHDTIDKRRKIRDEATPEVNAAVDAGTMSVNAAHEETFAEPPRDEPKKPKAPAEPKDATGKVLPENLLPIFARVEEITALQSKLSALKGEVIKLAATPKDPIWGKFDVSQFQAEMDNARNLLKAIKPYAVCPWCAGGERGSGKHCRACEGAGWLSLFHWKMAPAKMREDAKE